MPWFYIVAFVFGTIFGSFVNVLIYRLPRGEGVVLGRSKCPHCRKILKWYDLGPLISFLVLRSRCRNCNKKISWSYFFVELYSGLIFLLSFIYLGNLGILGPLAVIFLLEILLVLFVTDIKEMILPDSVILAGVILALLFNGFFNSLSLGHILTALCYFLIFFSIWFLSRGTWLGLGDAKLMLFIGLMFGTVASTAILYCAIILGTLVALFLLIFKEANLKTKLPFGSFICLSASVYIFYTYFLDYDIINQMGSVNLILNIFK